MLNENYIRQVGASTVMNYAGLALGYLNLIILLPVFLTAQEIGIFQTAIKIATLGGAILLLGLNSAAAKYFGKMGLRAFLKVGSPLFIIGISLYVILLIAYIALPQDFFVIGDFPPELSVFPFLIGGGVYLKALLISFHRALKNVALATFLNENVFRIAIFMFAIVSICRNQMELSDLLATYLSSEVLAILVAIYFLFRSKEKTQGNIPNKWEENQNVIPFSLFSFLTVLSGAAIAQVDIFMLGFMEQRGMVSVGIYSIAFFIASVIEIPKRSIGNLALPVLSDAFFEQNTDKTKGVLKNTALWQLVLASPIFIVISTNLEHFFLWMPNGDEYIAGYSVVLVILAAKYFDVSNGSTSEFISASQHYKVNLFALVCLAICNILLNLQLIPLYGINGAAYASGISLVLFNVFKSVFIGIKHGYYPYSKDFLRIIIISTTTWLLGYYFISFLTESVSWLLLRIILNSLISLALFFTLLYSFGPDSIKTILISQIVQIKQKFSSKTKK